MSELQQKHRSHRSTVSSPTSEKDYAERLDGKRAEATWIPFIVVLLMTGAFGWVAEKYYPEAGRLSDILNSSSEKR